MRFSLPFWHRKLGLDEALCVALMFAICSNGIALAARVPLDAVMAKQALMKRGIGKGVKITESDGTNVTGVLTGIHDDTFEVTPEKTFAATAIPYAKVVASHNDKSTVARVGKDVAIGAGFYVGLVFIASFIVFLAYR